MTRTSCPAWCRHCKLAEHRGEPIRLGRLVVTPVQPHGGPLFAEVRASYRLGGATESDQARNLLRLLRALARIQKEVNR